MNAEIVYQVVKALSKEEQILLLDKLNKDFSFDSKLKIERKVILLNKEEAFNYLLNGVFGKKNNSTLKK